MPTESFEIRICVSCRLRYPLTAGHPHGARCPACMGETRVILRRKLIPEPKPGLPPRLFPSSPRKRDGEPAVLLDNVRSAWNAGSILRTAEGFGFVHAFFCGITPTPDHEAVKKTSLGAEDAIPWSHHKDAVKLVRGLKKEGWKVYALEQDERAVSIVDASPFARSAQREILIVGNEVTGVDPGLLDVCDRILFIPMHGGKKSFNAAAAFAVAAYALHAT